MLRSEVVCRRCAPSFSLPWRAYIPVSSHTLAPLLEVGLHPSSALHCAGPDVALPCLALRESRSSPIIICRLFLSTTCRKMLLGGFWGGDSKPALFALRSQKRYPAKRERPQWMAGGLGMECMRSSSRSQSSLGTRHHRLGCAARPESRSREEPLESKRLSWPAFVAAARAHA